MTSAVLIAMKYVETLRKNDDVGGEALRRNDDNKARRRRGKPTQLLRDDLKV